MRTIVDIPPHILEELDDLARRENISRAEAVRRAMTEYLEKRAQRKPNAAFAIWKSRKIDSLAYEDALRDEWKR
jgi:metal-responsive CopG/Arc/MetJ family transcriptional regulator